MSGGKFTPLNLPSQGYTHGDAAYVPAIKQWCIVTASGGRVQDTEQWMRSILIAFTPDGLTFSPWQRVWSDGLDGQNRTYQGDVKYPSLMALEGEDNEVLLGSSFAVAFQYRGPSVAAEKHAPFWYVNVTVKV